MSLEEVSETTLCLVALALRGVAYLRETLGERHEEVHLEEKQGGDTVAWHSVEG